MVLFRGGSSTQQAVETLLTRRGAREVEMLVDLRMNPRTPCTLEARERMAADEMPRYTTDVYKRQVYENVCKKLACFSELSKDNQPEQILRAREKARTGEWFRSKELLKVIRHFYLIEMCIRDRYGILMLTFKRRVYHDPENHSHRRRKMQWLWCLCHRLPRGSHRCV